MSRMTNSSLRRDRGVTLMETTLATVIVGMAIVAIVKLMLTTTQANAAADRLSTGLLLAENLRELIGPLPFNDPAYGTTTFGPEAGETGLAKFNDVDDFDGWDSSARADLPNGAPVGPIDANRNVITVTAGGQTVVAPELANYKQQVFVDPVDPSNLGVTFPKPDTSRTLVRVKVVVSYRSPGAGNPWVQVAGLEWLKSRN